MNFKSIKKRLVLIMALVLVVSSFGATFAASTFSDLETADWASPTIEKWTGYDLIAGYADGTFKPNANITRAEFAVIAYNAYNIEPVKGAVFNDVKSSDWYFKQVNTMAKLGYIKGYADGKFKPNMPITRAEAAAIIASVQGLTADEEGAKIFVDYDAIPSWAKGHVGASAMAKFITGYSDDTFRASNTITRAESVSMLNNAVYGANYFASTWRVVEAGVYGGTTEKPVTVEGNVYIKSADVELKNVIIEGNLVFGKEIGEGEATIDGVVVKGETRVLGGGINSIHIKNSNITKLIIIKENNTIRIVAQGSTTIESTEASSGVKLQEIDLTSGKGFTKVDIGSLAGLSVEFVGLFDAITVDSEDVKVVIPAGTVVTSLVLDKAVEVTGKGTVTTAVVSVPGISFETAPKAIEIDSTENIEVTIGDKAQDFKPGTSSTDAAPAAGGSVTPSTPSKVDYDFYVGKITNEPFDMKVQLVTTDSYYPTDKFNFDMVEKVYEKFNTVPAYASNTITDILQLKNSSDIAYITLFNTRLQSMNTTSLKVFNDENIKDAVAALAADPINGDYTALANLILAKDLSDMLEDLAVIYPNEDVPTQINFSFSDGNGSLVGYNGTVKVAGLYNLVVQKMGNISIGSIPTGHAIMGVEVNGTLLDVRF